MRADLRCSRCWGGGWGGGGGCGGLFDEYSCGGEFLGVGVALEHAVNDGECELHRPFDLDARARDRKLYLVS